MPSILFFRNCCVARLWKYLEFLSPWVAHNALDLWNHILVSLLSRSLTSHLSCLAQKFIHKMSASNSTFAKSFYFSFNSFLMHQKFRLLHCFKAFPDCSIFNTIPDPSWAIPLLPYLALMVFIQPLSPTHISSKRKGFSRFTASKISGRIRMGEWSEILHVKWCIEEPPNRTSHSLFAKLLSNLSKMVFPLW